MKINYFYLVVGVLSVLFSFTHAWNGHAAVLPLIDTAAIDTNTKTTFFYVWHIITAENLIFGIAFLLIAFSKNISSVNPAALLIAAIIFARWGVISGSTLIIAKSSLAGVLVDSIAMFIYIILILLGVWQNNRIQDQTGGK